MQTKLSVGIFNQEDSAETLSQAAEVICIDNFHDLELASDNCYHFEKIVHFIDGKPVTPEEFENALASLYAQ